MGINRHQPRTATLWLLAIVIIVVDQLTKAWFVFKLGNLHQIKTFGEFLPKYFSEFNTSLNPNDSIISDSYHSRLVPWQDIEVWDPWIRWYLTTNKGAAWSMFEGNSLILSGVSLAIAALLWWVWKRNFEYHRGMTIAIGAIIGGALGNFIDRFRLHEVVDFIAVLIPYIGRLIPRLQDPYQFPIFNVADACAVCGTLALAGYLLWLDLTAGRRKKREQEELNKRFRPFDSRDPEAIARVQQVDTSKVPVWNESMNAREEDQAEISRARAEAEIKKEVESQLPELTADYQPTASALQVQQAEAAANADGQVTSVDNDSEDENVVV
jgi:signal peptidase II